MRSAIIDKIKALGLSGYNLSNETPYSDSGEELFIKNQKTIYVDQVQTVEEPLLVTLDGTNVISSTTSVLVYFSVDAKNIPANYTSTMDSLRNIKETVSFDGSVNRNCNISTSYEGDLLVNQLEYEFNRIRQ